MTSTSTSVTLTPALPGKRVWTPLARTLVSVARDIQERPVDSVKVSVVFLNIYFINCVYFSLFLLSAPSLRFT